MKDIDKEVPQSLVDDLDKLCSKRKLTAKEKEKAFKKLEEAYFNAKINPGESIGIITAESFGEPGTQMSIDKDEKIIVKIKDRIRILKIGDFVDKLMKDHGSFKLNDSEILPISDVLDAYVPSLNSEEKIEWKKVVELSRHKPKKSLLKIVTRSGRSIVATDNHSFVIRDNNCVVPIKGSKLSVGDRIPVMKYLPEHCISEINLKDYISKSVRFPVVSKKQGLIVRKNTRSKALPEKLKLDFSFGWFIGAYLAEGCATNGHVSISNLDEVFVNDLKSFVKKLGLTCIDNFHQRGFSFSRDLKINSSLLANFLLNTCKSGSSKKIVPDFCFSAKEEFVKGLLRGYFDGDANFTVSRKMIRVSSNSKDLVDGISLLLNRFNIFSHKVQDSKGQFWLIIPYKYASLFLKKIGSTIPYKKEALESLAEISKNFYNEKSQDYTDMISGFGSLLYDVAKKLNYRTRYVHNFTKRQKIGRTTLFRYMKLFERLAKDKNVDIQKELKLLNQMFYSDVVWDEIVKIESLNSDNFVYDLSVPGLETFTTFDGIITHNTLNVFHFAGVSEMSVTSGLPRLIEIFDATKSPKTPQVEVYLQSKYKNSPKDIKRIAASLKETTLNDVVEEFAINSSKMKIEIRLDSSKLKEFSIKKSEVTNALKSVKAIEVKETKTMISVKSKQDISLGELYHLKEKIKDTYIKGVKKITHVLPIKKEGEYTILCAGSNLKDILQIDGIDFNKTRSNDLFETAKILGIEAARQLIIEEAQGVIQNQGLDVDIRHILLLADVMTAKGGVKGITRSGITGEKESVLARASFETPLKHLINASIKGEIDPLNSVIENVMMNQPIPLGTGLPDLVVKMDKENVKKGKSSKKKSKK